MLSSMQDEIGKGLLSMPWRCAWNNPTTLDMDRDFQVDHLVSTEFLSGTGVSDLSEETGSSFRVCEGGHRPGGVATLLGPFA